MPNTTSLDPNNFIEVRAKTRNKCYSIAYLAYVAYPFAMCSINVCILILRTTDTRSLIAIYVCLRAYTPTIVVLILKAKQRARINFVTAQYNGVSICMPSLGEVVYTTTLTVTPDLNGTRRWCKYGRYHRQTEDPHTGLLIVKCRYYN